MHDPTAVLGTPFDEVSSSADGCAAPSNPVDLRELARVLDLSVGTVSRALNNHPKVNEKTKTRVFDAARQHGYVPNSAARVLKSRSTLTVGLFFAPYYGLHGEINPAALAVIESLRVYMQRQGIELRVLYYQNDAELKEQARAVNVGIFMGRFEAASFKAVYDLGVPAIVYTKNSPIPNYVSVLPDTRAAGQMAVQYLAALGHRRVGLVTGPGHETQFGRYHEGVRAALAEFRMPVNPDWLLELPESKCNKDGTAEVLLPLLKRDAIERPTAIIFASDWFALGGRKAARDAGLSVPRDLSLVGYDNLAIGAEIDPPLTTFDVHLPGLVQTMVKLVVRLGSPKTRAEAESLGEFLVRPDLIKRGSCECLWPPIGNSA